MPILFSLLIPRMLMFILAISCLTMSNFPWFVDLTFQFYTLLFFAAIDFCFITRYIHDWGLYPLWPSCFIHSGAIGNSPLLFPSSIVNTFRPGGLIVWCHIFLAFLYSPWGSHGKYTRVVCHSLLQRITFCQNPLLWPVHLGWLCMACLIASLNYVSPFTTTRQWSMKGTCSRACARTHTHTHTHIYVNLSFTLK